MPLDNNVPKLQRALVLQGGGALGAYESGAITVLCEYLTDENKRDNKKDGPLFDIIAGTSIGAMNAAVLVSNVVNRKKTWQEAAKELENFWIDEAKGEEKKGGLSSTPALNKPPGFRKWWSDEVDKEKKFSASPEASRRYYSVKEYKYGVPNVSWGPILEPDIRFTDPDNTWFVYDSSPLQETIERYSKDEKNENNEKLRIVTSWQKKNLDYLSSVWM
jgi:NTE family protein